MNLISSFFFNEQVMAGIQRIRIMRFTGHAPDARVAALSYVMQYSYVELVSLKENDPPLFKAWCDACIEYVVARYVTDGTPIDLSDTAPADA